VHGHARHIGRTYRAPQNETIERSAVLGELRERLRRAIDNEQFEQAAELRDRIKGME
jgi:protein-arginine kinase activator protein McsA